MTARGARPRAFRGVFRSDADARAVYAEAAGIARIEPLAVAVPVDASDVATLVAWADATDTPLVPRGSGSSMAGGAVGRGVVVDVSRLDTIEPVNRDARTVRVGPGAIHARVDAAARAQGLRLPAAPSSAAFCTIGGTAATNAAGAHSLRHGAMRRWVHALDCVFADGARAEVRRGDASLDGVPAIARFREDATTLRDAELLSPSRHAGVRKEASGYALSEWARSGELVDLLVGSEGTLAIFVGVELALAPLPGASASLLGVFDSLEAAVRAASAARELGAAACELLDRTFLDVAADGNPTARDIPGSAEAVLLAEVEGDDANAAAALGREIERAFRTAGASRVTLALDAERAHTLWALRHAVSPILSRLDPAIKSMQVIEDGAVPPERLPAYVRGVRDALERHRLRGVIFGHAGDGHVHVNPLVDVTDASWRARIEALLVEVTDLVAELGGTVSGEHGDGRLRAPILTRCWSAASLARFAQVKRAFDPRGILNPGAKIAIAGQRALDAIKYDPALPPLPPRARRALDRVERERAYATYRLTLLDTSGADGAPLSGIAASPAEPAD